MKTKQLSLRATSAASESKKLVPAHVELKLHKPKAEFFQNVEEDPAGGCRNKRPSRSAKASF